MIQPEGILLQGLLSFRIVKSVLPFSRYPAFATDAVYRANFGLFSVFPFWLEIH